MLPKLERSAERMTERGKWKEGERGTERYNKKKKKQRKCEKRKGWAGGDQRRVRILPEK